MAASASKLLQNLQHTIDRSKLISGPDAMNGLRQRRARTRKREGIALSATGKIRGRVCDACRSDRIGRRVLERCQGPKLERLQRHLLSCRPLRRFKVEAPQHWRTAVAAARHTMLHAAPVCAPGSRDNGNMWLRPISACRLKAEVGADLGFERPNFQFSRGWCA